MTRIYRPAIWIVTTLVATGAAVAACDTPAPTDAVQSTTVRLIPDVPAISSQGGDVVVVVQLATTDDVSSHFTTVVQAYGGSLTPLPGGVLCPVPSADAGLALGVQGPELSAAATIPAADFRKTDNQVDTFVSAITLGVPAGSTDVLLVAAAYKSDTD
ncbi:MAG: hypothetical protein ACRENE_05550, partial [Polyangiaceae bacterium]